MYQQPIYQYAAAPAPQMPAPRQYSGTSSAFSPSALPDEDWTKISDLAERRRIQNRIAQRNYRKKLKTRLQELEKRAGAEKSATKKGGSSPKLSNTKSSKSTSSTRTTTTTATGAPTITTTPPMQHTPTFIPTPPTMSEDVFPSIDGRDRSHSPMFPNSSSAYSPPHQSFSYPPLDDQGYLQPSPYSYPVSTMSTSSAYLSAADPVTMGGMCSLPAMAEPMESKETFSPYNMRSYYVTPSIDINAPNPYGYSDPQTPPLSHSFDHSASCSEAGYEYPATPLSIPSPGMMN